MHSRNTMTQSLSRGGAKTDFGHRAFFGPLYPADHHRSLFLKVPHSYEVNGFLPAQWYLYSAVCRNWPSWTDAECGNPCSIVRCSHSTPNTPRSRPVPLEISPCAVQPGQGAPGPVEAIAKQENRVPTALITTTKPGLFIFMRHIPLQCRHRACVE